MSHPHPMQNHTPNPSNINSGTDFRLMANHAHAHVGVGQHHSQQVNNHFDDPRIANASAHSGKNSSSSSTTSTARSSALGYYPQQQQQPQNGGTVDLYSLSQNDLVQRVKKLETDLLKLACDHNSMIREANHQIQVQGSDLTNLKNTVTKLEEDNNELRDLCCFLDDDRQKGRKLAREWQRFGRYTATVMRQEVAAYQSKLRELDSKQQQLVSDNQELKELCLYLDEERNQNFCTQCGAAVQRDDGDGSSSSTTNPTEEYNSQNLSSMDSTVENSLAGSTTRNQHININFEDDLQPLATSTTNNSSNSSSNSTPTSVAQGIIADLRDETSRGILSSQIVEYVRRLETRVNELEKQETMTCPESVLNALQVLQVCQGLEENDIGDQEKALVRQMCNVVWKKLEDGPKLM